MSAEAILLAFLYLALRIAIILCVAFTLVWLLKVIFNITIDPDVYKWGKIIVLILIAIAVVVFLFDVLGNVTLLPRSR